MEYLLMLPMAGVVGFLVALLLRSMEQTERRFREEGAATIARLRADVGRRVSR